MQNGTADAEAFLRDFVGRHSFTIEKVDNPNVELLMRLPQQRGLSFELTLGLQNKDELNIGFEGFWSYFFPCEKTLGLVKSLLEGIASGDCRLAVHRQFDHVVKRVLEQRSDQSWREMYTAVSRLQMPIIGTRISYVYNDSAAMIAGQVRLTVQAPDLAFAPARRRPAID
jgi:hypothetical protein